MTKAENLDFWVIYSVNHPERPWEVKRVGLTNNPIRRYYQHLGKRTEWLQEALDKGLLPIFKTIQVVPTKPEALERESWWQQHYREQLMPLETMLFSSTLPRPLAASRRNARSKAHAPRHKLRDMDLDQLKADVLHLYVDEHLARGAITRALHLGTVPFYGYIKQWIDEYDEEHKSG